MNEETGQSPPPLAAEGSEVPPATSSEQAATVFRDFLAEAAGVAPLNSSVKESGPGAALQAALPSLTGPCGNAAAPHSAGDHQPPPQPQPVDPATASASGTAEPLKQQDEQHQAAAGGHAELSHTGLKRAAKEVGLPVPHAHPPSPTPLLAVCPALVLTRRDPAEARMQSGQQGAFRDQSLQDRKLLPGHS